MFTETVQVYTVAVWTHHQIIFHSWLYLILMNRIIQRKLLPCLLFSFCNCKTEENHDMFVRQSGQNNSSRSVTAGLLLLVLQLISLGNCSQAPLLSIHVEFVIYYFNCLDAWCSWYSRYRLILFSSCIPLISRLPCYKYSHHTGWCLHCSCALRCSCPCLPLAFFCLKSMLVYWM